MSVLIKGIDMPKDETCVLIHVKYNEDGKLCVFVIRDRGERLLGEMQSVPTPHGRLIDADKLTRKEIRHLFYHLPNGDIAVPIIDIEHAPTVIETEE